MKLINISSNFINISSKQCIKQRNTKLDTPYALQIRYKYKLPIYILHSSESVY